MILDVNTNRSSDSDRNRVVDNLVMSKSINTSMHGDFNNETRVLLSIVESPPTKRTQLSKSTERPLIEGNKLGTVYYNENISLSSFSNTESPGHALTEATSKDDDRPGFSSLPTLRPLVPDKYLWSRKNTQIKSFQNLN